MNSQNKRQHYTFLVLLLLLIVFTLLSAGFGAVKITVPEIFSGLSKWFHGADNLSLKERIFLSIRLPRTLLCLFVGASLAVGGVLMQSLFRNPIVEPGLVGTSSGAAFGAALYIVLGATFNFTVGEFTLPVVACIGGILSTVIVFALSQSKEKGNGSMVSLLLIGVAVNALFMSGVGFLSYIARDPQARSITFWNLGTLSGANWSSVFIVGFTSVTGTIMSLYFAKHLNSLILGEEEAKYLGVNIKQLKFKVLLINVIMVATATAFVGVISFVGLIVPHLLRICNGADNRYLIRNGALLGGIVLCFSDLVARILLSPAELPIGIVTSFIGVPVFVYLLRQKNYFF